MTEPDLRIDHLLVNPDPTVCGQGMELIRALEGEEAFQNARRVLRDCGGSVRHHAFANSLSFIFRSARPGVAWTHPSQADQLLRSYLVDCAIHALPALSVFKSRPLIGFSGAMPDLSGLPAMLTAVRTAEADAELKALRRSMRFARGAINRWWEHAFIHHYHDPIRWRLGSACRCMAAICATAHIRHTTAQEACRIARQAIAGLACEHGDPTQGHLGERQWQQAWLMAILRGRHTHLPIPASPLWSADRRAA